MTPPARNESPDPHVGELTGISFIGLDICFVKHNITSIFLLRKASSKTFLCSIYTGHETLNAVCSESQDDESGSMRVDIQSNTFATVKNLHR